MGDDNIAAVNKIKAGSSVHLTAARLVHILQTLEVLLPEKINNDEPPDDAGDPDCHDPDSEKFSLQGMYSHETV